MQLGVWGSAVSSRSGVWGRAPAEIDFLALKSDINFGGKDFNESSENQLTKFHPLPVKWFLKIHNLTFNDAQIDFNDTQFV